MRFRINQFMCQEYGIDNDLKSTDHPRQIRYSLDFLKIFFFFKNKQTNFILHLKQRD